MKTLSGQNVRDCLVLRDRVRAWSGGRGQVLNRKRERVPGLAEETQPASMSVVRNQLTHEFRPRAVAVRGACRSAAGGPIPGPSPQLKPSIPGARLGRFKSSIDRRCIRFKYGKNPLETRRESYLHEGRHSYAIETLLKSGGFQRRPYFYTCIRCKWISRQRSTRFDHRTG